MRKYITVLMLLIAVSIFSFGFVEQPIEARVAKAIPEIRHSPFTATQISNEDANAIKGLNDPALDPHYVRWLSMHNYPAEFRPLLKAIVDMVLNSLNPRYRKIVRTAAVPVGAPVVLRVNLRDYGIDPKAWDRLAEVGSGATPLPDPYFHTFITKEIQQLAEISVEWKPTIEYATVDGSVSDKCEIYVTAPGEYEVTFDGDKPTQTQKTTRNFTTPALTAVVKYKARVKGKYAGKDYDVSKEISVRAGGRCNLSIAGPEKEKKVEKKETKQEKTYASAQWIAIEPDATIRGKTIANLVSVAQTKNPILRADWFCVYSTIAPAYYDLIGLPQHDNPDKEAAKKTPKIFLEKDFEKLMNVNLKEASNDTVAGITDTRIVALHNRILQRFNTVTGLTGGYYYKSRDTDNGTANQYYLNQIVNFANPEYVATEIIANGRNGLNFYFVADNKGNGLNLAAAAVAQHSDAMPIKFQDKQVWAARNCMVCHSGGMIAIDDQVRAISQGKIALLIADKTKDLKKSIEIEEAFSPPLAPILATDNAKFIASVKAASGKTGPIIAKALEDLIWSYYDQKVTLNRMAWDSGVEPGKLKALLKEGINLDNGLSPIVQNPEVPIATVVWEQQGFAALMQYLISYQPRK